jgi:flagellar protein FliO/FliZ
MLPGFESMLTAAAALAAVLGLILLAARFLRVGGVPRQGGGRLVAREVLPLDAGRRLHLVQCDGREVLLLTGGAQDVVVGWLPDRDAAP